MGARGGRSLASRVSCCCSLVFTRCGIPPVRDISPLLLFGVSRVATLTPLFSLISSKLTKRLPEPPFNTSVAFAFSNSCFAPFNAAAAAATTSSSSAAIDAPPLFSAFNAASASFNPASAAASAATAFAISSRADPSSFFAATKSIFFSFANASFLSASPFFLASVSRAAATVSLPATSAASAASAAASFAFSASSSFVVIVVSAFAFFAFAVSNAAFLSSRISALTAFFFRASSNVIFAFSTFSFSASLFAFASASLSAFASSPPLAFTSLSVITLIVKWSIASLIWFFNFVSSVSALCSISLFICASLDINSTVASNPSFLTAPLAFIAASDSRSLNTVLPCIPANPG